MIKTSFLYSIFSCLVLSHSVLANSPASTDELFKQVFGEKRATKIVTVDVSYGQLYVGSINAKVEGDKVVSIDGDELKKILLPLIREDKVELYRFPSGEVAPELINSGFPLKLEYNSSELRFVLTIPAEHAKPRESKVFDDLLPYYSRKAVSPTGFSAGLNYKVEHLSYKNLTQKDSLLAQTDFFSNTGKVSLESRQTYESNREKNWLRQNSKLIFDRPEKMQRFEAGDVSYQTMGYQQYVSIGGVSVYSDFSLNPYRTYTPTSSFEYLIENRSLVKTFVNGSLIKTEYMSAGRYSVRDIPLNNGLNKIVVDITDELGANKILVFNEASSLDLMAQATIRYSLASGGIAVDNVRGKDYQEDIFSTGFVQYGLMRNWTTGLYAEGSRKYQMFGTNQILATSMGNFSFDALSTQNKFHSGYLSQLTYQLNLFGEKWFNSRTLTAKIEYRSPWYNGSGENFINRFDWAGYVNFNFPVMEKLTMSVGGNYQNPTRTDVARYGYNGNLNYHFTDKGSLTATVSRNRDESKNWSEQLYFFLNFSFGDGASYVSAYYDNESRTKRLTAIRDTGARINNLKVVASAEENLLARQGSLDMQYNTVLADVGVREEVIANRNRGKTGLKTSLRFLSAFAYVNNGEHSAFSVTRPISNSFVIFKPNEGWEGQKFGVQSTSEVNETEAGLFGEALISGLSPYQYRRLQLNPLYLEPGYVLGQESFVVRPGRNTGHLFMIGKAGLRVLKGRIVDENKSALELKVGVWQAVSGRSIPFFTGRGGEFMIEGVDDQGGTIMINDENYNPVRLEFADKKNGIQDLGDIVLPKNENAL